jgi:hypothetical protein
MPRPGLNMSASQQTQIGDFYKPYAEHPWSQGGLRDPMASGTARLKGGLVLILVTERPLPSRPNVSAVVRAQVGQSGFPPEAAVASDVCLPGGDDDNLITRLARELISDSEEPGDRNAARSPSAMEAEFGQRQQARSPGGAERVRLVLDDGSSWDCRLGERHTWDQPYSRRPSFRWSRS